MRHLLTIRLLTASLLLVLASIGFIPKQLVHDALANHIDSNECLHPNWKGHCLHEQRFHCDVTDLIVDSLYTFSTNNFALPALIIFLDNEVSSASHCPINFLAGATGRGPPNQSA